MTTFQVIETHIEKGQEILNELCYDAWRSTSLLIQMLNKAQGYYASLHQQEPENEGFYKAHVAIEAALEMINSTYNVPTDDERFEMVELIYDALVSNFIKEKSDDAFADLIVIMNFCNYVAGMRTYAWNKVIEESGPSEDRFEALKFAKRDEQAVEIAVDYAAAALK